MQTGASFFSALAALMRHIHSTATPIAFQNTGSCLIRMLYCLAFFALPDCECGSAITSKSSLFVTESITTRPALVASSSAVSRGIRWPLSRHWSSPVKPTRFVPGLLLYLANPEHAEVN